MTGTGTYSSLARVDELRDRHRDYYAALAEQGDAGLFGPDVAAWHRLLDSEYDNLTQALDWAVETEEENAALWLANIIFWVNEWRGEATPSEPWLKKALALGDSPSGLRAYALLDLGTVASEMNDRDRAWQLAQEALVVAKAAGDRRMEAWALRRHGRDFVHELGGREAATAILEESLAVARLTGLEHEVAHSLHLAAWRKQREDPDGFHRDYETALDIYRRVGDIWNAGWLIYGLAWGEPDPVKAQDLANEAMIMARDLEDQVMLVCVYDMMGWLATGRGEYDKAAEIFEETLAEFRRPGRKWPIWWAVTWLLIDLAGVDTIRGDFVKARARLDETLEIAQKHDGAETVVRAAKSSIARIVAFQGDADAGAKMADEAVAMAREIGKRDQMAFALAVRGDVAFISGDLQTARSCYRETLDIRREGLGFSSLVNALRDLAAVDVAEGQLDDAEAHLEEALAIAARSPSVSEVHMIETHLARVARRKDDLDRSDRLSASAVEQLAAKAHLPALAFALEERAALATARGDVERAAEIFGAVSALRGRIAIPVHPRGRSDFEADLAKASGALGSDQFEVASARGEQADTEEAVRLALL